MIALLTAMGLSVLAMAAGAGHVTTPVEALLSSEQGKRLLEYTIECALPADQSLQVPDGVALRTVTGQIGLVPSWQSQPLSAPGERWITACILARLNAFGRTVAISIRANHRVARDIPAETQRAFSVDEATFYGNLFTDPPQLYVCRGEGPRARSSDAALRVCSEGANTLGKPTSCGITFTGRCVTVCHDRTANGARYGCRGGGYRYEETITVFLRGNGPPHSPDPRD